MLDDRIFATDGGSIWEGNRRFYIRAAEDPEQAFDCAGGKFHLDNVNPEPGARPISAGFSIATC